MFLTDKNGKLYEYTIINNGDRFGILSRNFHFILEINNKTLYIKDVWVDVSLRRNGIWKSLLNEIKILAKDNDFNRIVSLGKFRRPLAEKAWSRIDDKKVIMNNRKKDYYIYL